jgi:hypothetical protein
MKFKKEIAFIILFRGAMSFSLIVLSTFASLFFLDYCAYF